MPLSLSTYLSVEARPTLRTMCSAFKLRFLGYYVIRREGGREGGGEGVSA